jgi:hypothetical protein
MTPKDIPGIEPSPPGFIPKDEAKNFWVSQSKMVFEFRKEQFFLGYKSPFPIFACSSP